MSRRDHPKPSQAAPVDQTLFVDRIRRLFTAMERTNAWYLLVSHLYSQGDRQLYEDVRDSLAAWPDPAAANDLETPAS